MSAGPFCPAPVDLGDDEGVCGRQMPCPQHGGKLAAAVRQYREATSTEPTVRQASASDPEIMALAAIVVAMNHLDATQRARALRYLNHRYAPSERPSVFAGGAIVPNMAERSSG